MKLSKKMVVLLIQIFVVALALAMTVSTYAWYVANNRVEVARTTINSAAGANTEILVETDPVFDTYMGQKGTDNEDEAPYYVEKEMTLRFHPLAGNSVVQLNFVSISIAKAKGGGVDSSSDNAVIPSFTWRLYYNGQCYRPDANGFAYYMQNDERVYIAVDEAITADVTFRLIYLDDESYENYLVDSANAATPTPYADVTPFNYSGYDYMRATFTVLFEIGVDVFHAEEPAEGEGGGGE